MSFTVNKLLPLYTETENLPVSRLKYNAALTLIDQLLAMNDNLIAAKAPLSALAAYQLVNVKNAPGGYPGLDGSGQLQLSVIPQSLQGGLSYQGGWNAASNTPAIPPAALANKGQFRIVVAAGATNVNGISNWALRDWIVSNGSSWERINNQDAVVSVAGKTGAILLSAADISDATNFGRSLLAFSTAEELLAELNVATINTNGLMSAADKSKLNSLSLTGCVGYQTFKSSGIVDGNARIPWDRTIPQISEGLQLMSANYQSQAGGTKVEIDATIAMSCNVESNATCAIFINAGVDAIAVGHQLIAANGIGQIRIVAVIDNPSAQSIAIMVRGCTNNGQYTAHGSQGVEWHGGRCESTLLVKEYKS